jgi:S-adenosylmethionine hydrolase
MPVPLSAPLLALFSDFGANGPYCGQVLAVWAGLAPDVPRVNLYAEVPSFHIRAGAHLLYAYTRYLPKGSVIEAVVDPGVGGDRDVIVVWADGYWFCGPDNGLLSIVTQRASEARLWRVSWQPEADFPATFHGRDVFAPIAAHLALHGSPPEPCLRMGRSSWHVGCAIDDPMAEVIDIDRFGNLITGIHGGDIKNNEVLYVNGQAVPYAERFECVELKALFWYVNSNGLIEVAANQASASDALQARLGTAIVCKK